MHTQAYAGAAQGSGSGYGSAPSSPHGPLVLDATNSIRDAISSVNDMGKRATSMADALFGGIPFPSSQESNKLSAGIPQPPTRSEDLRAALNELHTALAYLDATISRFGGV